MSTVDLHISCLFDKKKKIDKRKEINSLLRLIKECEKKSNADIIRDALTEYLSKLVVNAKQKLKAKNF